MEGRRSPLRQGLWLLAAAVLALVLPTIAFGTFLLGTAAEVPDPRERRGQLASVETLDRYPYEDGRIEELRLQSDTGITFEIALRVPDDPLPGRPLVVLLAGNETGRKAATLIRDPSGAAVAALSYPFREIPYREWIPMIRALPDVQRGILDTPAAVLLALDYLLEREDLAPERVELIGVSFGAYLVAVPAALDPRVDRLWLVHGSGAPDRVIAYGLEDRLPSSWLRRRTGEFLASVAGAPAFAPEFWIDRVAPRPVVVVSAEGDRSIPPDAVRILHEAVPEGTEILWTPGDHVHPKRPETLDLLSDLIRERVLTAVAAGEERTASAR